MRDQVRLMNIHEAAIEKEMKRRDDLKKKRIQDELDKQERRRRREEERKRRAEEERRAKLREMIDERIVKKGEMKESFFGELLSDVHANGAARAIVGIIGGPFTELLMILSAIDEAKRDETNKALAAFALSEEVIKKIVTAFLMERLLENGGIELSVPADFEARIGQLEEGFNLEKAKAAAEEIKEKVIEILDQSIGSSRFAEILNQNLEVLHIAPELVAMLRKILITIFLSAEPGNLPKVSFIE